ncbi:MAG: cobyric acid synthase [Nitrospirota bacterium]|nr:cobyric acid synthase [Nitrospirota bacterium]
MAKALMIQGTGSGAGKSLIAAALCRIFSNKGIDVAPFKAQNMALNSFITMEGGEIGRAQALQAEASRTAATVDMNPVLLKASGEAGSQVIIHGKVLSMMKAKEYYAFRKEAWEAVRTSYDRLSNRHDLIIMEGAGSPAEINLMNVDIVNMSAAKYAKAPVLLVGDIDKGGVFASIYGTVRLLGRDSRHIKGFIINKFRGDMGILEPGLEMIKEKTGKPVAGVLPYFSDLGLPEEDGLSLGHGTRTGVHGTGEIKVVVVRLKYISNFTDFDPLSAEPDVELVYSKSPADIENADLVIIPGSKNTVKDLLFLRESRLEESIKRAFAKGVQITGICGGYQMLGRKIFDPCGIESPHQEVKGLGLLDIETSFENEKTTTQVEAELLQGSGLGVQASPGGSHSLKGYEIHMGNSTGDIGLFSLKRISSASAQSLDGSRNKNCWGTYLHGIFENNHFRRDLLNRLREKKGLEPVSDVADYAGLKEKALDRLAELVRENLDIEFIERMLKL